MGFFLVLNLDQLNRIQAIVREEVADALSVPFVAAIRYRDQGQYDAACAALRRTPCRLSDRTMQAIRLCERAASIGEIPSAWAMIQRALELADKDIREHRDGIDLERLQTECTDEPLSFVLTFEDHHEGQVGASL